MKGITPAKRITDVENYTDEKKKSSSRIALQCSECHPQTCHRRVMQPAAAEPALARLPFSAVHVIPPLGLVSFATIETLAAFKRSSATVIRWYTG